MTAAAAACGAGTTSRATHAEMAARYTAIFKIVEQNAPTGDRFTYYAASEGRIVPKNQAGYRKVQRAILDMRRQGAMPWTWITDSTRWVRKPISFDSLQQAIEDCAASYRRSLWSRAETAVEVWAESESVAGVLYPVTAKWDVPLYPCRGQASDTFAYSAAQTYRDDERRLCILYVGDHDPHGYEIETNLHAKLVQFSGRDDLEWTRIACSQHDVQALGLRGNPAKKDSWIDALTGRRHTWDGPAVEVEAIPPTTLRARLELHIEGEVDEHRLNALRVAEESEREALRMLAVNGIGGSL